VTFEATEACHGEENMDKFFAVFQKSQVLGGWMGDKVKVYIRNHVTKFNNHPIKPSQMTFEELHAGEGYVINKPALMNINLAGANIHLATTAAREWYTCLGTRFFSTPFNTNQLKQMFNSNSATFSSCSPAFKQLKRQACTKKFNGGKLLIWLCTNIVVRRTLFHNHNQADAMENFNHALETMDEKFRLLLSLQKSDQLKPSAPQVKRIINPHQSLDASLAVAHFENRRREIVIIADE
jgi:hypothetical protein